MERKVRSGGLAGALSIIAVWALGQVGAEVPPEVASAFTTVISVTTGWMTRTTAAARSESS